MYSEEQLNAVMLKVLEKYENIPYTQEGLDFLLTETVKLLPKEPRPTFTIGALEDISFKDRIERKFPKITVTYANEKYL